MYHQKAVLVLITGEKSSPRKELARIVEKQLFDEGRFVYYLGIGGLMFGLDADIIDINMVPLNRKEHIRRLAEVAHIMLDAGVILIVSAVELNATDLDVIQTSVSPELVSVVWVGNEHTTDIPIKLHLPENENLEASADAIRKSLSL